MTEYIGSRDAAKLLRQALRAAFPETQFAVRCGRGTGYSWLSVSWTDGPLPEAVREITHRYEGESFNGMTDSYDQKPNVLVSFAGEDVPREVRFLVSGINTHREVSTAAIAWAGAVIASEHGAVAPGDVVVVRGHVLRTDWGVDHVAHELAHRTDLRGVDLTSGVK